MMIKKINGVVEYIEVHLLEEINTKDIEEITGFSDYHFRRTFLFLTGMSLNEYIRNRKLSLAMDDLILGHKVIDVAFKYGYQSSDGFSNAFQKWCGKRPSEISKTNHQYFFPKLEISYAMKGGISMEFRIEEKERFNIIGVSKRVPLQFEGENNAIIELAQSITQAQREEMRRAGNLYPHQVVNASFNFGAREIDSNDYLDHMIGFLSTEKSQQSDMVQLSVEKHLWAVFPTTGEFPKVLQNTWARIFAEWIPASNYELVDAPEISFTRHSDPSNAKYSEIWIAVKEK